MNTWTPGVKGNKISDKVAKEIELLMCKLCCRNMNALLLAREGKKWSFSGKNIGKRREGYEPDMINSGRRDDVA